MLIDARPGAWDAGGPAGHAALRAANPGLIIAAISWFGESGPYKDYAGADAVVRALAGLVRGVGPAEAPIMLCEHQSYLPGALSAFSAALAALIAGGEGRRFEISLHDANTLVGEFQDAVTTQTGFAEMRWGRNHFFPVFPTGVYPTKEGWLGVTAFSADQWRGFCDMLSMPELVSRPGFASANERLIVGDELDEIITERLAARTAREWADMAIARRVPLVVTPDMAGLLASDVHRGHGAFGEVRIGAARFTAPVLPQKLTATPPAVAGVAPLAGAQTGSWRPSPPQPRPARVAAGALPLEGLRVIDLTMGWAGPVGTRQVADLGAEVIKVEGRAYPDWWRGADYSDEGIAAFGYEKPLYFNWVNRNKIGITLDLTRPEGVALLLGLVKTADAVVENYGTGVLEGFGLSWDAFRAAKPDIVMMSMPAFGVASPWAQTRAYGSTLEHASGLPILTGWPDDPPTMNHIAYGDPIGGLSACPALLTALLHRQRTGEGQFIDLSQVECLFPLVAPWLIEQSVTGEVSPRTGNRHPSFVPHGCFPCDGDDAWVVIAVTSDAAWRALCGVIGRADLAADRGAGHGGRPPRPRGRGGGGGRGLDPRSLARRGDGSAAGRGRGRRRGAGPRRGAALRAPPDRTRLLAGRPAPAHGLAAAAVAGVPRGGPPVSDPPRRADARPVEPRGAGTAAGRHRRRARPPGGRRHHRRGAHPPQPAQAPQLSPHPRGGERRGRGGVDARLDAILS